MYRLFPKEFNPSLKFWIALLSAVLASWIIYNEHGWINIDSILYFEMAKHIAVGDLQGAYQVEKFSWGFYPGLIALVHVVTGLSIQISANVLNVLFFMTLSVGVIQMVSLAGGDKKVQWCAFALLAGSTYIVGDVLPMAIRDTGYWAFMVIAVNQLILHMHNGKLKHAIIWQILGLVAMLFRIEGAVYLILLPLALIFIQLPMSKPWYKRLAPYSLLVLFVFFAGSVLLFTQANIENFGRINELLYGFNDIYLNISENLSKRVIVMRDEVIGEPFKEFAWFTFSLSLLSIITLKCLFVAGWAPALLLFHGKKYIQSSIHHGTGQLLVSWIAISWIIGCLITLKVNILSGRYVALSGIAIIVLSSFSLARFIQNYKKSSSIFTSKNIFLYMVCGIVVIGLIGNVKLKGNDYYYEIKAAEYVESMRTLDQKVMYGTARLRFYANARYEGRAFNEWQYVSERVADGRINDYGYIVVHLDDTVENKDKFDYLNQNLIGFKLDKVFYGYKKKKRILIFKRAI